MVLGKLPYSHSSINGNGSSLYMARLRLEIKHLGRVINHSFEALELWGSSCGLIEQRITTWIPSKPRATLEFFH
jgi:hypothetical protein